MMNRNIFDKLLGVGVCGCMPHAIKKEIVLKALDEIVLDLAAVANYGIAPNGSSLNRYIYLLVEEAKKEQLFKDAQRLIFDGIYYIINETKEWDLIKVSDDIAYFIYQKIVVQFL